VNLSNKVPPKPLITVITAVFNCHQHIEQAILSVINQSYSNIEYIIIDGGSTDGTVDIIRKYESHINYWISEQDNGVYDAWNKGILHSHGKWISFLGADDIYLPNAIEEYVFLINKYKNIQYISSEVRLISPAGKSLRTIGKAWNWPDFERYMNIAHVGSLHARSMFNERGLYNLDFKIAGDYEFLLRFNSSLRAIFLNNITVEMHVGGVSNEKTMVFVESAMAKTMHTNRWKLVIYLEAVYSFLKWGIRKATWY
jgi:glycosyltransferase involved in cell wall biosynthesis